MSTTPLDALASALKDRYRLERELGAGGMATVYQAEDLRHHRPVAIKVLRPELAAVIGAERFLAEISTTAALQHPHILPLFDSGQAGSALFYVMPLVEGESLRDRMNREKHLPIADAVRIASEVASALDYAHRHGIIHRDIKPENILLHDGRALVADFGIALAASSAGSRMTETGMSLGTPHYMSPEQAMGERELDARTDVYALGVVLYEMLTGDPPFTGSTAQAIVSKVVTEKPDAPSRARDTIPEGVEDAVLAALQKIPADRPASAAEFAQLLAGSGTGATLRMARPARGSRAAIPWAVAGILAVALAVAGWRLAVGGGAEAGAVPSRLALLTPRLGGVSASLTRQVAITPDGSTVYYSGVAENGENRTFRHRLDQGEPEILTTVAPYSAGYRVSPDGRWLYAVGTGNNVSTIYPLTGGGEGRRLNFQHPNAASFVAWSSDGTFWVTLLGRGAGVGIAQLTSNDSLIPLPGTTDGLVVTDVLDDRSLLVVLGTLGSNSGHLVQLDRRTGERRTILGTPVVEARYAVGHLVWADPVGNLLAAEFDPTSGTLTGTPVRIASDVSIPGTGVAQFDVATNGTVAYIAEAPRTLELVDRTGAAREATAQRRNFHSPRFSPDGRRIAMDFSESDARDVWLLTLDSRLLTRVTFDRDGHDPTWAPNGDLTYTTALNSVIGLMRTRPGATAPPESLYRAPTMAYTGDWLPDGSALLTTANALHPGTGEDIALLTNAGKGPLEPVVATAASEQYSALSPDGRWFAFVSNMAGREEVYLRRLDGTGEQVQVSAAGGAEPVWSRDGRELFYRTTGAELMLVAARVSLEPTPVVLSRTPLFAVGDYATASPHANYDVSPDGQQFVMVRVNPAARIMVIQNLPAMVARLRGGSAQP